MPSRRWAGIGGGRRRDRAVHRTGGGGQRTAGRSAASESGPRWPSLSGLSIEWMRWTAPSATSIESTLTRPPSGAIARTPGWPLTSAGSSVTPHSAASRAKAPKARAIGFGPHQRPRQRARLAAAVADEHRVGREHGDQPLHVALARGGEEALGERVALLGIGVEARALVADAPARAAEDLAAVVLGLAEHLRDLGERVVEGVAQHEHGALVGRQPLEQHEERERDLLLVLDLPGGPRPRPAARAARRRCRSRAARAPSAARRSPGAS